MSSLTEPPAHESVAGETHAVFNQPTPLENYNAFTGDTVLRYWVGRFGGGWGETQLAAFGHRIGHELLPAGFLANKHLPELQSHDRFGRRIDQVDYHPAYHQLLAHAKYKPYKWGIGKRSTRASQIVDPKMTLNHP